ncbi:alpha-tocopherol transfer protein-like [Amblyomma americanum]
MINGDITKAMVENSASIKYMKGLEFQDLGVTPAAMEEAVNHLRELIMGETLLECPKDDAFLLKFLRGRKFDVQRAFKNVKKYFEVRRDNPEMFGALGLHGVPFDVACRVHRLVAVSRKTDPEGRGVIMCKTGGWRPDMCSLNDFFRIAILYAEHLIFREEFQMKGIVAVLDLNHLSPYHLVHYTPSVIRTFISLVQDVLPLRIKGVYIINNPALFDILFAIGKPLMNYKLIKRIRFFGYNLEELHKLVPEDVIPEEHGGTLESYDYDLVKEELIAEDSYFQKINSYGYRTATEEATHL